MIKMQRVLLIRIYTLFAETKACIKENLSLANKTKLRELNLVLAVTMNCLLKSRQVMRLS